MGRSDSPPSISTRSKFFTSRYHRVARGLLPSVVGVPPGARECSVPGSRSGVTVETSGSPRFLGNPRDHCPCSSTPVGSGRLSRTKSYAPDTAPAHVHSEGSRRLYFRGSITRPLIWLSTLRRRVTPPHARLASGCWSGFARRDSYPQGFSERFPSSSLFLPPQAYLTQGHHT